MFVTNLMVLLQHYDDAIVEEATDRFRGIQTICKFPPTIAEVKELCEDLLRRSSFAADYDRRSAEQLKERQRIANEGKQETLEHRRAVADRIKREIAEAFAKGDSEPFNVFVPTFAPQYADMVKRGGRPGVSNEDRNRHGVWVPLSWLEQRVAVKGWKRFTDQELVAMYPKRESGTDGSKTSTGSAGA